MRRSVYEKLMVPLPQQLTRGELCELLGEAVRLELTNLGRPPHRVVTGVVGGHLHARWDEVVDGGLKRDAGTLTLRGRLNRMTHRALLRHLRQRVFSALRRNGYIVVSKRRVMTEKATQPEPLPRVQRRPRGEPIAPVALSDEPTSFELARELLG